MNFGDMTWIMTMAKCPCCKSHLAYSSDNNYNTWKCYSCGFTMFKQRSEQMMTREERAAISILNAYKEGYESAIEDYKQEPCDDAISRDFLFKVLDNFCGHGRTATITLDTLADLVYELPSVTQKSKTGHWILTDDDFVYCSECEDSYYPRPIDASWYYCPHCGCRMVEPQESEE